MLLSLTMSGEAVPDSEEDDSDYVLGACTLINYVNEPDPTCKPTGRSGCGCGLEHSTQGDAAYSSTFHEIRTVVSCVSYVL